MSAARSVVRIAAAILLALVILPAPTACSQEIQWSTDLDRALQTSQASGRPILLEFTAAWCVYCKRMEQQTFVDPEVAACINAQFIPVRIDADRHKSLVKKYEVRGLPAMLIVAPDQSVVDRISGFQTAAALLDRLEQHQPAGPPQPQRPADRALVDRTAAPGALPGGAAAAAGQMPQLDLFQGTPAATAAVPQAAPAPFQTVSSTNSQQPDGQATVPAPVFGGVCLVSAVEDRAVVAGSSDFQTVWRERVLYFCTAEHRARFLATPEKYWPMLDGICCVTLAETGRKVPGEVRFAAVFRNRVWLFTSESRLQEFISAPADMVEEALEEL